MRRILLAIAILFFFSCSPKEPGIVESENLFDLKGFFEKEAARLEKLNLTVNKTVSIDGVEENKKIKIQDFAKELNSFISSDINKASWRGAFNINKTENLLQYTTTNEKIPVKELIIQFENEEVKSIRIINEVKNILYHSSDTLTYFPDSLYEIRKTQKIKLIKEKNFRITGRF
ncbi:MAG: hypothetical protein EOO90_00830 [Pedobacter sp.]|nr:MAG: hypothetical protein EOO90_00830 [Pedobacter sp.]